jgi:hypothetical protein
MVNLEVVNFVQEDQSSQNVYHVNHSVENMPHLLQSMNYATQYK